MTYDKLKDPRHRQVTATDTASSAYTGWRVRWHCDPPRAGFPFFLREEDYQVFMPAFPWQSGFARIYRWRAKGNDADGHWYVRELRADGRFHFSAVRLQ